MLGVQVSELIKEKIEADYDEAFSKGIWKDEEAACYFLVLNPKIVIEVDRYVGRRLKVTEAQTLLDIINTWAKINRYATPFWYVNESLKRRPPYVNLEVLLDKIKGIFLRYSPSDRRSFSKKYEYLKKEVDALIISEKDTEKSEEEAQIEYLSNSKDRASWVKSRKEEIQKRDSKLETSQIAKLIHQELEAIFHKHSLPAPITESRVARIFNEK